jgi:hypothetical protein
MAMMAAIAPIMSIASAGMGVMGAMQQGDAARAAGAYQQVMDYQKANQALYEQQMAAENQAEKLDATKSHFLAEGAHAGAGMGDTPTIQALYQGLASKGETQVDTEVGKGLLAQQGWRNAGDNADWMGRTQQQASMWNAFGQGIGGLSKVNWGGLGDTAGSIFG